MPSIWHASRLAEITHFQVARVYTGLIIEGDSAFFQADGFAGFAEQTKKRSPKAPLYCYVSLRKLSSSINDVDQA